MKLLETPDNTN